MEEITKRIIWIDKKVKNIEIQKVLTKLEESVKGAKIYPVESIEEAFDLIKNKKEEIILKDGNKKEVKIFQFRLFYTIINSSLSEDFFNEYIKATKELTIISANIIFCEDEFKNKYSPYYLDDFLNSGKVYNEKSLDKIIDYINKDETNFLNDSYLMDSKEIYKPMKRSYGNVFFKGNNLSDIAYPFFFGQIINSTLINEYELESFQKFLLNYYPELKDLIIPSREKKMSIPYYLLAKFYLHMYTYENCLFFKNMNLDLTNDKFDIYRIYIFLLYDALNKKSIKSYFKKSLYRGTVLSKKEFENLENILKSNNDEDEEKNDNKKAKNENKINSFFYYCKMFLSFSKSEKVAKNFLNFGNDELIPVLFEVKGLNEEDMKNNNFFVSNLDLENISEYKNEEEVLFLPFSCFEILSITDEEIVSFGENLKFKRIILNYLYKYKSQLYDYIKDIKEKEKLQNFLKLSINSEFSQEIAELINFKDFDAGNQLQRCIKQKLLILNFIKIYPCLSLTFGLGWLLAPYIPILFYSIYALKKKLTKKKEKLTLFSDCLYYQYIPKKFREYCIPTLSWKGISKEAKSFVLELIEDGYRKWFIINIKKDIKEINNDNYLDVGETIVEYKGISNNPNKVAFILYEVNKEKINVEDFDIGDNDEIDENKKLSKDYYNQIAILDIFNNFFN